MTAVAFRNGYPHTQAILLAYLCHRYHDLATYASESLKQRVHFMAKPDGSNLKDLFIWDTPLSARSLGTVSCWTPEQIQIYLNQHWSADQFPLHPPNYISSWEDVDIYFKELDQETVQAMVPIGIHKDASGIVTVLVVLTVESDLESRDQTSFGREKRAPAEKTVWKYHDLIAVKETNWEENNWTILASDHPSQVQLRCATLSEGVAGDNGDNSQKNDEDDSDDDYWGQYGDTEDESAADKTNNKSKQNCEPAGIAATETPIDEDAEEELYWGKYSQQQNEQDKIEQNKKIQEQQLQQPLYQQSAARHFELQESSKSPTQLPEQIDPNMLSTLLHSLVTEGVQQMSSASLLELKQQQQQGSSMVSTLQQLETTNNQTSVDPIKISDSVPPLPLHQDSDIKLMDSMRSLVADFTKAGYTKEQVFALMETLYSLQ